MPPSRWCVLSHHDTHHRGRPATVSEHQAADGAARVTCWSVLDQERVNDIIQTALPKQRLAKYAPSFDRSRTS